MTYICDYQFLQMWCDSILAASWNILNIPGTQVTSSDPCFDYKRPCFWGCNPQNKREMGHRYIDSVEQIIRDFFSQDLSQRPSRCSFGCGRSTGTNFGGKNACFLVFWTREKLQGSLNGTHFGGHQTLQIYGKSRGISLVVVHCLGWS